MNPSACTPSIRAVAQKALESNKAHQYSLMVYTERLEDELQKVERLLAMADLDLDSDSDSNDIDAGQISIAGFSRPYAPVHASGLYSEGSPFHRDASRRQRYIQMTENRPMKQKELEVLTEAVRTENYRLNALRAQTSGRQAIEPKDEKSLEINTEGLNWDRIAESVTAVSAKDRSADECSIRWLGDQHPKFNHVEWDELEIARVKSLAEKYPEGEVDWVSVADTLGTNRTAVDCMRHAIHRRVHTWSAESDKRLVEAIKMYGIDNWPLVARAVSEDATPGQCQGRYYRTLDPSLKKGHWSPEEDELLHRAVAAHGTSWADVANVIPGRNNDQCRIRRMETLERTQWTDEIDDLLIENVAGRGQNWKEVANSIGNGKTPDMCRRRYETLKKRSQGDEVSPPADGPTPSSGTQINTNSEKPANNTAAKKTTSRPRPRKAKAKADSAVEETSGQKDEQITGPSKPPAPRPRPRIKKKADKVNPSCTLELYTESSDHNGIVDNSPSNQVPQVPSQTLVSLARPAKAGKAIVSQEGGAESLGHAANEAQTENSSVSKPKRKGRGKAKAVDPPDIPQKNLESTLPDESQEAVPRLRRSTRLKANIQVGAETQPSTSGQEGTSSVIEGQLQASDGQDPETTATCLESTSSHTVKKASEKKSTQKRGRKSKGPDDGAPVKKRRTVPDVDSTSPPGEESLRSGNINVE